MTAIAATELKKNFKIYAGLASDGEPVLVRRPKKEKNLVLVDEESYNRMTRIMTYWAKINGFENIDELDLYTDDRNEKSRYSDEFISLFGSIDEKDLIRPEQGDFSMDVKREVI